MTQSPQTNAKGFSKAFWVSNTVELFERMKVCRNARCTSFLFITIQICSFSLSCDNSKISLIYVSPASK
jgi:hypothetical protein